MISRRSAILGAAAASVVPLPATPIAKAAQTAMVPSVYYISGGGQLRELAYDFVVRTYTARDVAEGPRDAQPQ